MESYETFENDVLVVGAGGAGLRAVGRGARGGLQRRLVCKSLLGKAHTVMAEGGVAASLGNMGEPDNWKVHFMDTMKGGQFLNNPRTVEIFAKEAPERVLELEQYGAVFDRTPGRPDLPAAVRRPHLPPPEPRRRPHRPGTDPHHAGQGRRRRHGRPHGSRR